MYSVIRFFALLIIFCQCLQTKAQNLAKPNPAVDAKAIAAQPPADTLAPSIKALLIKAKSFNDRIRRQLDVDVRRRLLPELGTSLRDWINGQKWEFATKVIAIAPNEGVPTLYADCPTALLTYSNNAAAFEKGGLYSHQIQVAMPADSAAVFKAGEEIKVAGVVRALFGNDVPVRKPTDHTIVLLDLCFPPIEKDAPLRIEVSLVGATLTAGATQVVLPAPTDPPPQAPPLAKNPPLEAVLQELQSKVEKLVTEARRQKNTALITGILAEHKEELETWLEGQEWEFQTTVVDIVEKQGAFELIAAPPTALLRFVNNYDAGDKGGLRSFAPNIFVSRDLAETIGRGDTITYRGTVTAQPVDDFRLSGLAPMEQSTAVGLCWIYLPPLDRQAPLQIFVSLSQLEVTKSASAKRK